MDIALISVIVTGSVALGTVLLTPILSLVVDTIKWRREAKGSRAKKVEGATKDLLAVVAEYQTDIHLDGVRKLETIYADILTKGYYWQYAITPYCRETELAKVEKIRTVLLDRTKVRGQESNAIVKEILDLARAVDERMK